MKYYFNIIKRTVLNWYGNDPFSQSAAISYYTIFSFPAIAFIYLSLASFFADKADVQQQVTGYFSQIVGADNIKNIEQIIMNTAPANTSIWALAAGAVILLFAALKLFLQLQKTLNMVWKVKAPDHVGVWQIFKQRMLAFGVMLGILFIMLVTLFATTLITSLSGFIASRFSENLLMAVSAINFLISFSIISGLFTILLKLLPDTHVNARSAMAGGMFSAALFILGQHLIGIYFKLAEPASAYGVTASIILLMIWVSYTCVILLLGAELSRVLQEERIGNNHRVKK